MRQRWFESRAARAAGIVGAIAMAAGCADMSERQQGTAGGAAIGAAVGAVLSSATGGKAGTGAVIGGAIGALGGNVWSKKQEERRRAMEQATQGTGVQVTKTEDNQLKLNVPNDISFDVNSAAIKPELRSVLDAFAESVKHDPTAQLNIVGHADATGGDAINVPLSLSRAHSVRDYLGSRGVTPARIETAGRGSREPVASNDTPEGRAQNRRVEIFVREPAPQG